MDRDDATCSSGAGSEPSSSRRVGDYDDKAIMNYCSLENGDISFGDVQSSVFLYGGPIVSPVFRATSWLLTDLTYRASLPNGTSQSHSQFSVSASASNFSFGAAQTGALLDVMPSDDTLRCLVESSAPMVRDRTNELLYFTNGTIPVECYSPAIIAAVL